MANLRWNREAGSQEWTAESAVDDAAYVIDEEVATSVDAFIVWGRGPDVGDKWLGTYPNFKAAAEACQTEEDTEATAQRDRERQLDEMAAAEQAEELEGMAGYPDPEDVLERQREQRTLDRQAYLEGKI